MRDGTIEELVRYADEKNVGIWLWYHSGAGRENESGSTPVLSLPEQRRAEFARIEKLGIKGIKVDFFDTDKQRVLDIYLGVLEDAAEHRLMVNFHGATLPTGWHRTWPNLMTTEGIKGAEGFGRQPARDSEAGHNSIVPFTRNVVGSMDYTPVTFSDKIREGVPAIRKTSMAHELALSVVFESGVQNFADRAEAYRELPEGAKNILKRVPTAWDETRYLAGTPGDHVVLARRSGNTWFVAGINGLAEPKTVSFSLPESLVGRKLDLICDPAEEDGFLETSVTITDEPLEISTLPAGGFVGVIVSD